LQQHNAIPINKQVSAIPLAGIMTQKVRLNHTVFLSCTSG